MDSISDSRKDAEAGKNVPTTKSKYRKQTKSLPQLKFDSISVEHVRLYSTFESSGSREMYCKFGRLFVSEHLGTVRGRLIATVG